MPTAPMKRSASRRLCVLLSASLFLQSTIAGADHVEYTVIRGDTLSEIVWSLVPGKVYGVDGNLNRVIRMNPAIRNPHRLLPGNMVLLPEEARYLTEKLGSLSPSLINPNFRNELEVSRRLRRIVDERISRAIAPLESPPPVAEPLPEEEASAPFQSARRISLKRKVQGQFEVSSFYRFTGLTLRDPLNGSQSTLGSKMHLGVDVAYARFLSPRYRAFVRAFAAQTEFAPPSETNKSIEGPTQTRFGFSVGARAKLSSALYSGLQASFQREFFGRAVSTNRVAIDALMIPSLEGKIGWDFLRLANSFIGMNASLAYYLPSKAGVDTIGSGNGFGGTLYFRQREDVRKLRYETDLTLQHRSQSYADIEQTDTSIGVQIRFFLPFSSAEPKSVVRSQHPLTPIRRGLTSADGRKLAPSPQN